MAFSDMLVTTAMLKNQTGLTFPSSFGTNQLVTFKMLYDWGEHNLVEDYNSTSNKIIRVADLAPSSVNNDDRLNKIYIRDDIGWLTVTGINTSFNSKTVMDTVSDVQISITITRNNTTTTFQLKNTTYSVSSRITPSAHTNSGHGGSYKTVDITIQSQYTSLSDNYNKSLMFVGPDQWINISGTEIHVYTNAWEYFLDLEVSSIQTGQLVLIK